MTLTNSLGSIQLNEVHQLIDRVAERQCMDFGNILSDLKPDGTLITECDRWSDLTLVNGLQRITKEDGVLSEEGNKVVPSTRAFWVVDPLDGTTNFAAGIPHWAISVARFVEGQPDFAVLDLPVLKQRIVASRGHGAWLNGKRLSLDIGSRAKTECVSLCSRSIRVLQRKANDPFPGKIRLLGVSSLNMVGVALGQTIAALEATPKIWDLASAWLVLSELMCPIQWLDVDPSIIVPGQDLASVNFPLLTASSKEELTRFLPWGMALLKD